jgi:hypothetical protein
MKGSSEPRAAENEPPGGHEVEKRADHVREQQGRDRGRPANVSPAKTL